MSEVRPRDRAALAFGALAAIAAIVRLVALTFLRPLNFDEVEFFRATDWVRRGLVPYRDFWEHHTPLQWFLFAPFTAFIHSPGAAAIVAMRWIQLPLWIGTFWLLLLWMRDAGIGRSSRIAAVVLALTSSIFMLPASEYRVDVIGCALYILGLLLVQRMNRGVGYAFAAGVAFCLTGFANLRMGPLIAVTILLARIVNLPERKWKGSSRANWIFAGGAAMFAAAALYFVATGSLAIAFQRTWTDNYIADKYAPIVPLMFIHRFVVPFGLSLIDSVPNSWSGIDPAGAAILVIGTIGIVRAIRRGARQPDDFFFLAFVSIANLIFIGAMKFAFNYHLLVVVILFTPFVAGELQRWRDRRVVAALLLFTSIVNVAVALFRGKEADLAYQGFIMREVERRTPAGSKVWDGSGLALHHPVAYRYWFLREIVNVMVERHHFELYTAEEMAADPPAAVIADHYVRVWIGQHPGFGHFVVAHYLPVWRDLWMPGMSARLDARSPSFVWSVPADGTWAVYASARLADHHWFVQPIYFETRIWRTRSLVEVTEADRITLRTPLQWFVDGAPAVISGGSIALRKGQKLGVVDTSGLPIGIMLVRGPVSELFLQPPRGITIEASASPVWHVPRFSLP